MSNTGNLSALLPLVIFMAIMVGIGFYVLFAADVSHYVKQNTKQ